MSVPIAKGADNVREVLEAFGLEPSLSLQVETNPRSGYVKRIVGMGQRRARRPAGDEEFIALSKALIGSLEEAFGYPAETLVPKNVRRLSLSRIGSTDKVAVTFAQEIDGIEVEGAWVSVLFDARGNPLSVENHGATTAQTLAHGVLPELSEHEAIEHACDSMVGVPESVRESDYVLYPLGNGVAVPAWRVLVRANTGSPVPEQKRVFVCAKTGTVLEGRNTIHHFVDLQGSVEGWATPGAYPDTSSNPEERVGLSNVLLTSSAGTAHSDSDGSWLIPFGGNTPQDVTASFDSGNHWSWVVDLDGPELSETVSATPGVPATITMNAAKVATDTAEINAHRWSVAFREFVQFLDPSDHTMDFRVLSYVNWDNCCNAYYDGFSINFFRACGGCVNSAYSSVVLHELGHWAVSRYQGSASGAFHEGCADIWSMYILDDPVVGRNFCGAGCHIRTGLNTLQKCQTDCGEQCHGGSPHKEGEVLMGAFWKMRANLNAELGDAAGDETADLLFLSWLQSYNDRQICNDILTHLLILDDDDNDLSNGTPHCDEIASAFIDTGWPDDDVCSGDSVCPTTLYGSATPGTGGAISSIEAIGEPIAGTPDFTVKGSGMYGSSPGFLLTSASSGEIVFGSATILNLLPPIMTLPFVTSGIPVPTVGKISISFAIPDDPSLLGLTLYQQFLTVDPGGADGYQATQGLQWQICE